MIQDREEDPASEAGRESESDCFYMLYHLFLQICPSH